MKRIAPVITTIFVFSFLVSCSSGNKDGKKDNTRVLMENITDSQGIQRMQVSKVENIVEHKGKNFAISLTRVPDEVLPMVESEVGDTFIDNRITLHITQDGKEIFQKAFTKQDFAYLVGSQFLKKSMLEGMVFDKATPQGLVFAVSVSYPQTDLFFPISVTVSETGKMSMEKEEMDEEFFYE
ncbi:DUF4738 domain-containing protein [Bacteroides sp. 519]|uniref:DUF4738 domain-containing protein n=1 Tax=Bacteroides sp. 519 TaxID=2302937 RepID=UPI0013CFDD2D|nr:DUF4738 domain-containing protein [Bacteroides sp. 519]NDV60637.1 DUF4738 domain-containing protein [Bacteroides sp. 519]